MNPGRRWELGAALALASVLAISTVVVAPPLVRQRRLDQALTAALNRSDWAAVRTLVTRGANPNTRAPWRTTALMGAAKLNDLPLLTFLLEQGADPNLSAPGGYTALHYAAAEGTTDAMRLLLKRGALVDARDRTGDTPLSVALAHGHGQSILAPLIAAGADVNTEDRDGTTPLFRAAVSADPGTVTFLLDHGARGSARAESPLRLAQRLGRPAVSRVLRQRGID